jgi:putative FmdB family regulatory protein
MPIYEYRCTSCHDEFEVTQKITAEPLKECPRCQGAVEKLISHSSFVLKGSGWYQTDYARKGEKPNSDTRPESGTGACPESGTKPSCSGCPGSAD